jgi:hypothetical protein
VTFHEGDNLVVFYYLRASERGGRDNIVIFYYLISVLLKSDPIRGGRGLIRGGGDNIVVFYYLILVLLKSDPIRDGRGATVCNRYIVIQILLIYF